MTIFKRCYRITMSTNLFSFKWKTFFVILLYLMTNVLWWYNKKLRCANTVVLVVSEQWRLTKSVTYAVYMVSVYHTEWNCKHAQVFNHVTYFASIGDLIANFTSLCCIGRLGIENSTLVIVILCDYFAGKFWIQPLCKIHFSVLQW